MFQSRHYWDIRPEGQKSKCSEVWKIRRPEVWKTKSPDGQKCDCPEIRMSKCLDGQNFEGQKSKDQKSEGQKSGSPDGEMSRNLKATLGPGQD